MCKKELARLAEAERKLNAAREQYDLAWQEFIKAVTAASVACAAAIVEGGLNPAADIGCAGAIYWVEAARQRVMVAAAVLGAAEAMYSIAKEAYETCCKNCPSWAWKKE